MTSQLSESAQRVQWLLKKVWHGSQSRMAEETGISQSAISNVVTGRQQPGRKMLERLSSSALVNSTWLVTGHGDPLISAGGEAGRRAAYIARQLFEGLPDDHGDSLGHMLEVPLPYYRPSRYWIQIDGDCPLLSYDNLRLAEGDHVLFDPDKKTWPKHLAGHPCVISESGRLTLGCVARSTKTRVWLVQSRKKPLSEFNKVDGKHERDLMFYDEEPPQAEVETEESYSLKVLIAIGVFRMGTFDHPETSGN